MILSEQPEKFIELPERVVSKSIMLAKSFENALVDCVIFHVTPAVSLVAAVLRKIPLDEISGGIRKRLG